MRWVFLAACGLAACGQTVVTGPLAPEEVGDVVDGSRLRAVRWVPEDGTVVLAPVTFEDAGLDGARCTLLGQLEGPEARCYPGGFTFLGPVYSDAGCEQALLPADLCEEDRPVVFGEVVRGEAPVDDVYRAFRATDERVTPSSLFYIEAVPGLETTGTCGPLSDSVRALSYPWAEGALVRAERIEEAAMVALEEEVVTELGDGLEDVVQRWSDGTVARFRVARPRCVATRDGDGLLRCPPPSPEEGPGPALRREAVGRGRLRAVRLLDPEGRAWPVGSSDRHIDPGLCCTHEGIFPTFRDTALEMDCVPESTVEGVRCLPLTTVSLDAVRPNVFFVDSGCTERVAAAWGDSASTATHAARRRATREPCEARRPVSTLERLGPRLRPGTPLFSNLGRAGCEPAGTVPEDASDFIAWRLEGAAEDLTRYARFRESLLD